MASVLDTTGSTQYAEPDAYIDFQLEKTRSGVKSTDMLTAVMGAVTVLLGYLLLFVLADHWLVPGGFGVVPRAVMLGVVFVACGAWLAFGVVLPAIRRVNTLFAARLIEDAAPQLRSTLLNLVDLDESGREIAAPVRATLEKRAAVALSQTDIDQAIDRRPLMRVMYALLAVVVVGCLYTLLTPKKITTSVFRALLPLASTSVSTRTEILDVKPGDVEVLARAQQEVVVDLRGQIPDRVLLLFSTADRKFVDAEVELRAVDDVTRQYRALLAGENGRGILQDMTYRVVAGDATSRDYRITVKQPPSARVDSVQYDYPAYMEFPPKTEPGGTIDAWEGVDVTVTATVNMPVKSATLRFTDTEDVSQKAEDVAMKVVDGTKLTAKWTLGFRSDEKSTYAKFYRIEVKTEAGEVDPQPTLHGVTIRPDLKPDVILHDPTRDLERPANAIVPLMISARDDFKLRAVNVRVQKNAEDVLFEGAMLDEAAPALLPQPFLLKLEQLAVKPGDTVTYWVEARDNRSTTKRKEGQVSNTQKLTIKIIEPVAPQEARRQLDEDQQRQEEKLEEFKQKANEENANQPPEGDDQNRDDKDRDEKNRENRQEPNQGDDKDPNRRDRRPEDGADQPPENGKPENGKPEKGKPEKGQDGDRKPEQGEQKPGQQKPGDPNQRGGEQRGGNDQAGKPPQGGDGQPKDGGGQDGKGQDGQRQDGQKQDGKKQDGAGKTGDQKSNGKNAGDKNPSGKPDGTDGPAGEKGSTGDKPAGDKPAGDKAAGDKAAGDKAAGDKPAGDKKQGLKNDGSEDEDALQKLLDAEKKKQKQDDVDKSGGSQSGDKQSGDKASDKPSGDKPSGDKPSGDKKGDDKQSGDKSTGKPSDDKQDKGDSQKSDTQKGDSKSDASKSPDKSKSDGGKGQTPENGKTPDQSKPGEKGGEKSPANTPDVNRDGTPKDAGKPGTEDSKQDGSKKDGDKDQPKPGTDKSPDKGDGAQTPKNGTAGEKKDDATKNAPGGDKGKPDGKPAPDAPDADNPDKSATSGEKQPNKPGDKPAANKPTGEKPDGEETPADDSTDAKKTKATGKEKGPAKANDDPDADPTKAENKLDKKPGEKPTRRPSDEKDPSKADPEKAKPEDADKPGRKKSSRKNDEPPGEQSPDPKRAPGSDKGDQSKERGGKDAPSGQQGDKKSEQPSGNEKDEGKAPGKNDPKNQDGKPSDKKPDGQKGDGQKGDGQKGDGQKGDGQKGDGQKGDGQKGDGQKGDGQKGDGQKGDGQKGDGQKGDGQKGDGQKGDGQKGEGGQASGKPGDQPGDSAGEGKIGGGGGANGKSSGSGDGGGTGDGQAEEANPEDARKAANLVLRKLEDQIQRGEIDPDLLKEMGWTKDDMQRFAERLKNRLEDRGDDQSPAAEARRRQFEESLKNLDMRSGAKSRKGADSEKPDSDVGIGPRKTAVPSEYREAYEAYTRGISKRTTAPSGKTEPSKNATPKPTSPKTAPSTPGAGK